MNLVGRLVMGGLVTLLVAGSVFGQEHGVTRPETAAVKTDNESMDKAVEQQAAPASKTEEEKRWYEKIEIALGATGVLQGSPGAEELLGPGSDVTDGSMSFDLELTLPVAKHGKFYTLFEAGAGDGIDGDIPTLSGFNDDADDDQSVRLTEIWYEHAWFSDRVRLRGGKVDLTTDFDTSALANSETDQFLSSGFVNNLAVEFPDDNGFGAMLWASPGEFWDIGVGIADADADWDKVFEDVFSIVELDFKPKISDRQGNYRIYGWFNGSDHEHLNDDTKTRENNYGFGVSFDQEITGVFGVFARYGWQRGSVSQIEHSWSAGFQGSGGFYGREDDIFGLAYGRAIIGDAWRDVALANGINSADEHHVEFYYNLKVNDHLNFSPNIQWVKNPNGDSNDNVWAFGLRAQLSF